MRKQSSNPTAIKRVPRILVAAAWTVAIGAPSLYLHTSHVEAARRDAERLAISQVAAALHHPAAGRDEVVALVERQQRALNDQRYVRTCNRLGIPMNWNTLFAEIRRRGSDEQKKAARIIAEECDFEGSWTLKREQMTLALSLVADGPHNHTVPVPTILRHSFD